MTAHLASAPALTIRTASDRALLVECGDLGAAMALHAALEAERESGLASGLASGLGCGITELVPGANTLLVHFDPRVIDADRLRARIAAVEPQGAAPESDREVLIPVRYDGADLVELAGLMGVEVDEIVRRHIAATWRVGFSGFAPGFGYLVCDDPFFAVPRRSSPRTRVPEGSVALAGNFAGVYPRESPGGWQLIGRTDEVMWDLHRDPPALFAPGTAVRFTRAEPEQVLLNGGSREPRTAPVHPQRRLTVVESVLPLLVQDLGRPGHAALGVSPSGAADRGALRLANRSVGNAEDAAAVEIAFGSATFQVEVDTVGAVCGAVAPITLTDATGSRPVPPGRPFVIPAGSQVSIGAPTHGVRSMLALRGGVAADSALDSRATDTLAGLGPQPLTAGCSVSLGDPALAPAPVRVQPRQNLLPTAGDVVTLEITLGPRDDWFTDAAINTLLSQTWSVTPRSDRVGIRLAGDVALQRARDGELPSEGAVTGAIQVPPEGQPVLFLPDHPLTGGYPIIGAVVDRCLDLMAQLPPGAGVRFRVG